MEVKSTNNDATHELKCRVTGYKVTLTAVNKLYRKVHLCYYVRKLVTKYKHRNI